MLLHVYRIEVMVNCRIGSLEMQMVFGQLVAVVNCRIGSLENGINSTLNSPRG